EAAVGAGISTVLILGTLHLTRTSEARARHTPLLPLLVSGVTAGVLVWATIDAPAFGDPEGPISALGPDYLDRSLPETGGQNVVSSVLASYRGFDTLGEVTVVFTAGIGVLLLLVRDRARPGRSGPRQDGEPPSDEA